MLLDYKTIKMRFQKTFLLCCVTICARIELSGLYVASHNQLYRRRLPTIFIEISSRRIKVGIAFIFFHLVDVMALWYTSNVLNNLKLFFSMPSNSNRIIGSFILKEKQVLVRKYCFLACKGPVENLQVSVIKKWVNEREKNQLSA